MWGRLLSLVSLFAEGKRNGRRGENKPFSVGPGAPVGRGLGPCGPGLYGSGPYGPGPYRLPWALMGRVLMGQDLMCQATMGGALMGRALLLPLGKFSSLYCPFGPLVQRN